MIRTLLLVTAVVSAGCVHQPQRGYECGEFAPRHITSYPHVATPEREQRILRGYPKILTGMSVSDVKGIMGEPDEINLELTSPTDKAHSVAGHNFWYVLRRRVGSGSVTEKQESLVRVTFSLEGRVSRVAYWGLDGT